MKVKLSFAIIFIFLVVLTLGCAGPLNFSVRPDTSFKRHSTITITSGGYDPLGVQGQMEHLLVSRGFEVISEAVAHDKLKYKDKITSDTRGQSEAEASLERIEEVRSIYILRFSYGYRADFPHGNVFTDFTASIVDLETGKVEVTADFSQGQFGSKSVSSVLREFADKLRGSIGSGK